MWSSREKALGGATAGQQRSCCGAAKLPPPQQSRKSSTGAAHVAAMQFGSTEHPPIRSPPAKQPGWPFLWALQSQLTEDGDGEKGLDIHSQPCSVRAVKLRVSLQATGFGFSDPWISPVTDVTPHHRNS
ncbi:uncharacterized protein PAN0_001c0718 [Moesziomyces antarcticus]|uniref:Uncharacterized protein n=1 Tax=Pseudozyma antarctica TaxID=84753 RepID=A0A5C3FF66_PSEA2|nr:uncharacterized protein PAN0_001c0718 [Moesziomyces antarcticus]GAK62518.1 hypothetical protein PAN0_001c0718 [Moesziomyces antarcticus]SPO43072.1 uncharacterized protein PSANT_00756 [Moesziomyces antarcticus]